MCNTFTFIGCDPIVEAGDHDSYNNILGRVRR